MPIFGSGADKEMDSVQRYGPEAQMLRRMLALYKIGGQFGTETGQHVILESQANLKLGDPLLQTHTDTPSPNRKSSVNTRRRRSSTAATCSAV